MGCPLGVHALACSANSDALSPAIKSWPWDKTDYCLTWKGNRKYNIECYRDIAANIEAAAACMKETGDPSYFVKKGKCPE